MSITFSSQARHYLGRHIERQVERLLSVAPDGKQTFGNASQNKMVLNVLEKSQQFGDHASHLRLVTNFAGTLQHSVNLTLLEHHLTQALAQEMPKAEYIKLASLHIRLLTQRGELERAEEVLEGAWAVADTPLLQAELYNRRATLLDAYGNYAASQEAYIHALELAHHHGNLGLFAIILNNLGNRSYAQDDYEQALIYFKQVLEVAQKIGEPIYFAIAEGGMAMTLGELERYEEAKEYHQVARHHYEKANDRVGVLRINLNSCYLAIFQKDYEEAKRLASSALIEAQQLGDLHRESTARHHLGSIHLKEGDYESASEQLTQALKKRRWLGKPLYERTTRESIQQLIELIEADRQLEPALRTDLLQRIQLALGGDAG